jgi:hypothetical protein
MGWLWLEREARLGLLETCGGSPGDPNREGRETQLTVIACYRDFGLFSSCRARRNTWVI